jgi:hypothetical protein
VQDNEVMEMLSVTDPNRNKNKKSLFKTFQMKKLEIDIPLTSVTLKI